MKPKPPKSLLQKQREEQRFKHGIDYVIQAAPGIKKINSSELAHLNQLLTGNSEEPWRFEATQIQIPSGHTQHFNVTSNPIQRARDILGNALQRAGNDEIIEAAADIYAHLVLEHLFEDANRRTAVLAALWLLLSHNKDIDAHQLLDVPIGNLREAKDLQALTQKIRALVK